MGRIVCMPLTASSKKRVRRNERVRIDNRLNRGKVRAAEKAFRASIERKDKDSAAAAFLLAQSAFARGVSRGVVPKNRCAAKVSRFAAMLKTMR